MNLLSIAIFVIGTLALFIFQTKWKKARRKAHTGAVKKAQSADFDWQTFTPEECKTTLADYVFPRWWFGRWVPRWRRLYVIQSYAHNRKARALWGARVLVKAGHNAGLSTYVPKARNFGVGRYQRIEIAAIEVGDNVSINHVTKMPDRKSFLSLDTDDFRAQVRSRTKSAVEFDEPTPGDFVLKLGLTKDAGVPTCVPLSAALRHLENLETKQGQPLEPLAYAVVGFNWEYKILNLGGNTPHKLDAGATGGGKTVSMIGMDIVFMLRNSPDAVRFIWIDMKRNAFKLYFDEAPHQARWFSPAALDTLADAPARGDHVDPIAIRKREKYNEKTFGAAVETLIPLWNAADTADEEQLYPRIATNEVAAVLALEFAQWEMERRFWLFEHHRKKNVWTWNNKTPRGQHKLYLLIVQTDEVQVLTDGKGRLQKRVEGILKDISARGREAGVLISVGTQTPTSAVLPTSFRGNLDTRIAFPCDDDSQSKVIIGRTLAAKMGAVPDGRAIMKRSGKMTNVQIPFVADADEPQTKWPKHVRGVMKNEPTIQDRVAEIVKKWSGLDPRTCAVYAAVRGHAKWLIEETAEYQIYAMHINELRVELKNQAGFGGVRTVEKYLKGLDGQKLKWEGYEVETIPPAGRIPRKIKFVPQSTIHNESPKAGGDVADAPRIETQSAGGNGDNPAAGAAGLVAQIANLPYPLSYLGDCARCQHEPADAVSCPLDTGAEAMMCKNWKWNGRNGSDPAPAVAGDENSEMELAEASPAPSHLRETAI